MIAQTDEDYANEENAAVFEAEERDLFLELSQLPKNATVRKVNELVKRARAAKVHAYVLSHLRARLKQTASSSLFGNKAKAKSKAQSELLTSLKGEFQEVHKKYGLPLGDFPPISKYQQTLPQHDWRYVNVNRNAVMGMCRGNFTSTTADEARETGAERICR